MARDLSGWSVGELRAAYSNLVARVRGLEIASANGNIGARADLPAARGEMTLAGSALQSAIDAASTKRKAA